jgi:hypothetical protein
MKQVTRLQSDTYPGAVARVFRITSDTYLLKRYLYGVPRGIDTDLYENRESAESAGFDWFESVETENPDD